MGGGAGRDARRLGARGQGDRRPAADDLLVDVDDPGPAQARFPRLQGAEQLELLLAMEDT